MILVYRVLATLLYPFLFIFIYCRKILGKEDPKRYKEKFLYLTLMLSEIVRLN